MEQVKRMEFPEKDNETGFCLGINDDLGLLWVGRALPGHAPWLGLPPP